MSLKGLVTFSIAMERGGRYRVSELVRIAIV